ncbi:LacI family DNA-binding transcriptional regulator [Cerasicoccus frondis]|uniref:LacI family DNA-binding transcriptional regulator n=1 Tax=Cerasicoccus frondis TaxID=490090 RepID=UPI00285294E8|nr:LacI family DNA-binding transcriptional regulator [Cerasicoccus frondis]
MSTSTLKDVAEATGLSVGTVSLVLRDKSDVSIPEKTRRTVKDAAKKIGYQPRNRQRSTKTLAIVTFEDLRSRFDNPNFAEIYAGAEDEMTKLGYHALIKRLHKDEPLAGQLEILSQGRVDGVLLLGQSKPELLEELHRLKIPVVYINESDSLEWDSVMSDVQKAFELTFETLRNAGHRKILCIKTAYNYFRRTDAMDYIFRARCWVGMDEGDLIVLKADGDSADDGYLAMKQYLAEHPRPEFTAAFTGHYKPYGMVRALRESGYSVPDDISVIAIGGIAEKDMEAMPLSTIRYPLYQLGQEGVLRLIQRCQGLVTNHCRIVLPVDYVDRGTVTTPRPEQRPK